MSTRLSSCKDVIWACKGDKANKSQKKVNWTSQSFDKQKIEHNDT